MYKVWKFRLYPNLEQQILINKNMGCCRLVFNTLLDKKLNNEKMGKYDLINMIPELKKEKEFLKEVESSSLQNVVTDLMNGFDRYKSGISGKPRFKKKGTKESYRINCVKNTYKDKEYENITLDLMRRKIKLPKLGLVDIRGYRKEGYFPLY